MAAVCGGPGGVLLWVVCLNIWVTWHPISTVAAVYRHTGPCGHKGERIEAGQAFIRGCDKCYCHDGGYICLPPMKPTSWPSGCRLVATACGYRLVYRERPALECHAYSWVW